MNSIILCLILPIHLPLIYSQENPKWPWSQAFIRHNASTGLSKEKITLATVVLHNNRVFSKREWVWSGWYPSLRSKVGEEIHTGCRIVNGSAHEKVTRIGISHPRKSRQVTTKYCVTEQWDSWHNFTLVQPTFVNCRWQQRKIALHFKFQINTIKPDSTTQPSSTPLPLFEPSDNDLVKTLQGGSKNLPLNTTVSDDPWSKPYFGYTGIIGNDFAEMSLATAIIYDNRELHESEWKHSMHRLKVDTGKTIHIGCRTFNTSVEKISLL